MAGGYLEPLQTYLDDPALTDAAWYDFSDYAEASSRVATRGGP